MKVSAIFSLCATLMIPGLARAESFTYDCKLMTDYRLSQRIEVSETTMKMFDQVGAPDSDWKSKIGTAYFNNHGLMGGRGKMKDRLRFVADYKRSEVDPGEISEFFLSPELTTGGMKLRNGSMGGFMTFAGHVYSYETYICFLED